VELLGAAFELTRNQAFGVHFLHVSRQLRFGDESASAKFTNYVADILFRVLGQDMFFL
jgi:hypothetical protein